MGNGSVGVPRRYLMGHRMLSCVLSTGDFWRNESQGLEFTGPTVLPMKVLSSEVQCLHGQKINDPLINPIVVTYELYVVDPPPLALKIRGVRAQL